MISSLVIRQTMILKTYKDAYKNVASRLELDESVVSLLGDFVYEQLGRSLDNYEHRITYLYGLGHFTFRKLKSENYIRRIKNIESNIIRIRKYEVEDEEKIENKVKKMEELIREWDKFLKQRETFKLKKKEYYVNRDIQEQGEDMGGTTK